MHMGSLFADESWSPEGAVHLDFTSLEGTSCYLDPEAAKTIFEAIKDQPLRALHWIDSGDYHYLTALWLDMLERPAELLLLDHHPDDQAPAFGDGLLSCGGWVDYVRRHNPLLQQGAQEVYLSIDLDYLSRDFARTDWDQGDATLDGLFGDIRKGLAGRTLAGVDICGGISSGKGGTAEDYAVNRRTREALLDFFKDF